MIGAEQKIKPDRPAPLRPADLMDLAVNNAQVETLSLSPNLQGLAANRSHALESARPAEPKLGAQRGIGAAGVLAGLLGVATGNEGLAAAGTGVLQGSLANIQQAMTEYSADLDGFEEGFQRLQLLEAQNEAKMAVERNQTHEALIREQAKVSTQEAINELMKDRQANTARVEAEERRKTRDHAVENPTLGEQASMKSADAQMKRAEAQLLDAQRRSSERPAPTKSETKLDKLNRDLEILQEREAMGDQTAAAAILKKNAEIAVEMRHATQEALFDEISEHVGEFDIDDVQYDNVQRLLSAVIAGRANPELAKILAGMALDQGAISPDEYASIIEIVSGQ